MEEGKTSDRNLMFEDLPTLEKILAYDINEVRQKISKVKSELTFLSQSEKKSVKELIVDQGAIGAIFDSLESGEDDLILVSLDTLEKLMKDNPKSNEQFNQIDGSKKLSKVLLRKRDYTDEKNKNFLESAFSFLYRFILNRESGVIDNVEACDIIFNLIANSDDTYIIQEALEFLSNLVKRNWKNTVILFRLKAINFMSMLMLRLAKSRALLQDGFTLELISAFTELKDPLTVKENERTKLLQQVVEIF
mmetsp:Transcript_30779/g.28001  ORF Transcript_30779/g.28001 Transcript_30779/m.28001 type:complete len:249 (+) Transcript_30779:875-1621(+)